MPVSDWGPSEEQFWADIREFIGIEQDTETGRELFDIAVIDYDLPYAFVASAREAFEDWVVENYDPFWSWDEDFPWDEFREWYGVQ